MTALVSVVVTTYYRNERLKSALDSVRAQTYEDVEIIVVDGSGEAHARPVVDEAVEYVVQDEDRGPHAARAEGAERAAGDYIQFLDDDDALKAEKIESQIEVFREDNDIGVVYCGVENEFGDVMLPRPEARGDILSLALKFDLPPCNTTTMLIDANVVEELLPFPNRHGADDIGMKIELAKRTQFEYIDRSLVVRGEPDYRLGHTWAAIEGRREILRRYSDLYNKYPASIRRTALASIHENAGHRHVESRVWSPAAICSYSKMIWYTPAPTAKQWGQFLASFLGRPGFRLLGWAWRQANRHDIARSSGE